MRPLPSFKTVTEAELREIWKKHREDDVRRVCLKAERYRRLVDEIEKYRAAIDRAWHSEVGGSLVGLYQLRLHLNAERERLGVLSQIDRIGAPTIRRRMPTRLSRGRFLLTQRLQQHCLALNWLEKLSGGAGWSGSHCAGQ